MDDRTGKDILFFGGTFDPLHNAHLIISREVAEKMGCKQIVFVPNGNPPHKEGKIVTAGSVRADMLNVFCDQDPLYRVSQIEIQPGGPRYTIDTVRHLKRRYDFTTINWLIGGDQAELLHTWHDPIALVQETNIITVSRTGEPVQFHFDQPEIVDKLQSSIIRCSIFELSSTLIRQRAQVGQDTRYYVPDCIADFIKCHKLYQK